MSIYFILKDFFNWISKYKKSLLIKEEKTILLNALKSSHEIHVLSTDQDGDWIRVGEVDFLYNNDTNKTKAYVYALETLCKKSLVRHVSGALYKLTAQGFEKAKKL